MKTQLIVFYLNFVNNWLTVEKYADFNDLPVDVTKELLKIWKKLSER